MDATAPTMATVPVKRSFFEPPAFFELEHARYGWTVAAGIGGACVVLGLLVAVLLIHPELGRRQVDALGAFVVMAAIAAGIVAAIRLVRGPRIALVVDGESLSLIQPSGKALTQCAVSDVTQEPVICRMGRLTHAGIRLRLPSYPRTLVVAGNLPIEHLSWSIEASTVGEATHQLPDGLWRALVQRLGSAAGLDSKGRDIEPLEPPREIAFKPAWRRYTKLAPFSLPLVLLPAMMLFDEPEPAPECLAAARCCLARAHLEAPVAAAQLRECTAMAWADADRCAALHTQAAQAARAAGTHCDESLVKRYDRYQWSSQSRAVPGQGEPQDERQRYPRVSCRDAALRLVRAVETQQAGERLVIRPRQLMTQAVSLSDPNATLYCEGYPLPIARPVLAASDAPIVAGPGPHSVLLRPLPSGRFDLLQYCLGCNLVGSESRH